MHFKAIYKSLWSLFFFLLHAYLATISSLHHWKFDSPMYNGWDLFMSEKATSSPLHPLNLQNRTEAGHYGLPDRCTTFLWSWTEFQPGRTKGVRVENELLWPCNVLWRKKVFWGCSADFLCGFGALDSAWTIASHLGQPVTKTGSLGESKLMLKAYRAQLLGRVLSSEDLVWMSNVDRVTGCKNSWEWWLDVERGVFSGHGFVFWRGHCTSGSFQRETEQNPGWCGRHCHSQTWPWILPGMGRFSGNLYQGFPTLTKKDFLHRSNLNFPFSVWSHSPLSWGLLYFTECWSCPKSQSAAVCVWGMTGTVQMGQPETGTGPFSLDLDK